MNADLSEPKAPNPFDPESLGPPDETSGGFDAIKWLSDPIDKSVHEADIRDIWSPEDGGFDRLALVFESAFDGPGLPRGVHLIVAIAEISYLLLNDELDFSSGESEEEVSEDSDGLTETDDSDLFGPGVQVYQGALPPEDP